MNPEYIYITLGIFTVIIFVAGLLIYEKKRTAAFARIAAEQGFQFAARGDRSWLQKLVHFHLFSRGYAKRIKNLVYGESQGISIAIFGYKFTVGGGKNQHTVHQTVVYFSSDQLDVPDFDVRPENLFHRIGKTLGYQDIDFDDHPEFSKRYLLRGQDEVAIRSLFTDNVISVFENLSRASIEGRGNQLIVYHARRRIKPEQIESAIKEALEFYKLFAKSSGPLKS